MGCLWPLFDGHNDWRVVLELVGVGGGMQSVQLGGGHGSTHKGSCAAKNVNTPSLERTTDNQYYIFPPCSDTSELFMVIYLKCQNTTAWETPWQWRTKIGSCRPVDVSQAFCAGIALLVGQPVFFGKPRLMLNLNPSIPFSFHKKAVPQVVEPVKWLDTTLLDKYSIISRNKILDISGNDRRNFVGILTSDINMYFFLLGIKIRIILRSMPFHYAFKKRKIPCNEILHCLLEVISNLLWSFQAHFCKLYLWLNLRV